MFLSLALQGASIALVAAAAWIWLGREIGLAVWFGGAVASANAGLLVYRWRRGLGVYHCDGARHLRSFHRSSLERFFVVTLLMAVGLGLIRLAPLPMIVGFVVGQLAWVIAAAGLNTD